MLSCARWGNTDIRLSDDEKIQHRNGVDIRAGLDAATNKLERRDDSYRSWDYCFNYFQEASDRGELSSLVADDRLEVSCMQLGFYLASFGMMRGGTDLYKRSATALVPVVRALVQLPDESWSIDVDGYAKDLDAVMDAYEQIKGSLTFEPVRPRHEDHVGRPWLCAGARRPIL